MSTRDDDRNAPRVRDVVQRISREHHEVRHGSGPDHAYRVGVEQLRGRLRRADQRLCRRQAGSDQELELFEQRRTRHEELVR